MNISFIIILWLKTKDESNIDPKMSKHLKNSSDMEIESIMDLHFRTKYVEPKLEIIFLEYLYLFFITETLYYMECIEIITNISLSLNLLKIFRTHIICFIF